MEKLSSLFLTAFLILASCQSVPFTQRKQLTLIPDSQLNQLAEQSYKQFLDSAKVIETGSQAERVKTVGKTISCGIDRYFENQKKKNIVKDYEWQFNLIEDTIANAWAMPGGRVAVYTGLLDITKSDDELAAVVAHEIAHVIANHGDERLSQGLIIQLGGIALDQALRDKPNTTRQLFMLSYGIGSQVGLALPFSRLQESEADRLGIIFMAMAGYDPKKAISFWQSMIERGNGDPVPEFLSTHPSSENRVEDINKRIDEAMKYFNTSKCR